MFKLSQISLLCCALFIGPQALHAQNIDKAVGAFKAKSFEESAGRFYEVIQFSEDPGEIAEAQYGLAKSFQEVGLYLASLKYYEGIVAQGADHPFFKEAVEGLVDMADQTKDDLKIPAVINKLYDKNLSALAKMSGELRQRIHYLIGRLSYQRGMFKDARDFLRTVKEGNSAYARSQYLLGLIRLGVGRVDQPKAKYEKALEHFENVRTAIPELTKNKDLQDLRDLASLGVARVHYEIAYLLEDGNPQRAKGLKYAIYTYQKIPRFSPAWSDALFERAWAHTVNKEYGKALGAVHSLQSPYFEDKYYPESEILSSIVYYYNCQWDKVNEVLTASKEKYKPVVADLEKIIELDYSSEEWYYLLEKSLKVTKGESTEGLIPSMIATHLKEDAKFKKMQLFLDQIEKEVREFSKNKTLGGEMGREMGAFAVATRDAYFKVIGKYVQSKLKSVTGELSDVTTRIGLVSLETKTAETEWLEQGRSIAGKKRKRFSRPFVSKESFQFWWFNNEYWIDELGYYEYKIKSECHE